MTTNTSMVRHRGFVLSVFLECITNKIFLENIFKCDLFLCALLVEKLLATPALSWHQSPLTLQGVFSLGLCQGFSEKGLLN